MYRKHLQATRKWLRNECKQMGGTTIDTVEEHLHGGKTKTNLLLSNIRTPPGRLLRTLTDVLPSR